MTCLGSQSLATTKQGLEAGLLPPGHSRTPGAGEGQGLFGTLSLTPPAFAFPDLESIHLQDSLLAFSSPGPSADGWSSPEEPPITAAAPHPPGPEQQHWQRLPGGPGPEGGACLQGSLPSVDSGSLSEDEVFYN